MYNREKEVESRHRTDITQHALFCNLVSMEKPCYDYYLESARYNRKRSLKWNKVSLPVANRYHYILKSTLVKKDKRITPRPLC